MLAISPSRLPRFAVPRQPARSGAERYGLICKTIDKYLWNFSSTMHIEARASSQLLLYLRSSARAATISPKNLRTLQDLLDALSQSDSDSKHLLAMLRSTAMHISACLRKPLNEIEIADLVDATQSLKTYLSGRAFKRNSIRSYANYARILLSKAEKLGWAPHSPEVEKAWAEIYPVIKKRNGAAGVLRFAIRKGKKPLEFTDKDLEAWGEEMLRQGRSYSYVRNLKGYFRGRVASQGLRLPKLPLSRREVYALPVSAFPESLRQEVENLIRWKTAPFSPGRPAKGRHRLITAGQFEIFLRRFVGLLIKVKGRTPSTLEELLSRENLTEFVAWCINERKIRPSSLVPRLGMLYAAAKRYPPLQPKDFGWMRELISELPEDTEALTKEAKERKWVPYDKLAEIPAMIRADSRKITKSPKERIKKALLARDELLITWMTTLPWRQRNLRECKLGRKEQGANLFKDEIPPYSTLAILGWIQETLMTNAHAQLWQLYFRAEETKTGQIVHSLLPRQLIAPLEEYLMFHRPMLLRGEDPGTLFLNSEGRPLTAYGVEDLVARITVRYSGRRVTPHLFRDIFAVKWLEDHPEDYLTLSKILWHRNIQTTLRIYGRNFDESHGVRRTEEWLDQRSNETQACEETAEGNCMQRPAGRI